MIRVLAVEGYRSLRDLRIPLANLNVVTGANGTGKSSVYKALQLLADAARNGAVQALAREGGLPSALWAGPEIIGKAVRRGDHPVQGTRRRGPVQVRLGFAGDDYGYAMDLGLPPPVPATAFALDPEIKREAVWHGPVLRPAALLSDRHGGAVRFRDGDGWFDVPGSLPPYDSMLGLAAVDVAPELVAMRRQLQSWRFYDHFRTDPEAPARRAQIGTRTPALGHDGSDLAAALQTILEIGDGDALSAAIDNAFPGSHLEVTAASGRFDVALRQPGMLRPLPSAELSDGTLRYLLLVAALLTPRPPQLLVFNEPETSLHPDLHGPLAELIAGVAEQTQIVVVSHARGFVQRLGSGQRIELAKDLGETRVVGQEILDRPRWAWPAR